jgi:uncharacterized RDD family membrane protein YckC
LIDLAVLLGVFLVLSVATGGASWDQGASFTLDGWAAILFLALVLGHYFGLEAALGQTVGKYLLELRVVRPNGSRPPIAAITVRSRITIHRTERPEQPTPVQQVVARIDRRAEDGNDPRNTSPVPQ